MKTSRAILFVRNTGVGVADSTCHGSRRRRPQGESRSPGFFMKVLPSTSEDPEVDTSSNQSDPCEEACTPYRQARTSNHREQIGSEFLSSCSWLLMRLFILSKASSAKWDVFGSERGSVRRRGLEGSRQARSAQPNCSDVADRWCVSCWELSPFFLTFAFSQFHVSLSCN